MPELPLRVWISVFYRPPDHVGPGFAAAAAIRGALREEGIAAFLWSVDLGLDAIGSPEHRDVVFPVAERYDRPDLSGDSAGLRQALEERGIPFVGSGARAARDADDKDLTKRRLAAAGVAVPDGVCLRERGGDLPLVEEFVRRRPGPAVVKPAGGRGGSHGVKYAPDSGRLRELVESWRGGEDAPILVEEFVAGTEVTAWVVGVEPDVRCLNVQPIAKGDDPIYGRAGKSGAALLDGRVAAPALPAAEREAVAAAALTAHSAAGAFSYSRVDAVVRDGLPVVLEVNARPTLSSAGRLAIHGGQDRTFGSVMAELVGHALLRPAAPC